MERARSETVYQNTGNPETHRAIVTYDLYCENCDMVVRTDVRKEEKEEPHAWNIVRSEPTCIDDGEEVRLCGKCRAENKTVLPATGHQFAGASQLVGHAVGTVMGSGTYEGKIVGRVVSVPSCTENGSGVLVCINCQKATQIVSLPALGHDWSPWEDVEIPENLVCVTDAQMIRRCRTCGLEENRVVSTAPGHQWQETKVTEATCTQKGSREMKCAVCHEKKNEDIPALGHLFADVSLLVKRPAGEVAGSGENAGKVIGRVDKPSTCTESGSGALVCLRCQEATQTAVIPQGEHNWGEWQKNDVPEDQVCVTDVTGTRQCLDCGEEETQVLAPAPGHKWAGISFEEPTCEKGGRAVRQCAVCHKEEVMEAPPLGHTFMWVDKSTPSPTTRGVREYVCTVCGYVAETQTIAYAQMFYNNTITSFGPMTRDLIGGNVWNRVTPIDLSQDGVYTYPLIASNLYTVGTATILIEQGTQTFSYKLNAKQIKVHSESLIIYPNLESLRTGENSVPAAFDTPLYLSDFFGDDNLVIVSIALRADYDARGAGIQDFRTDQELIQAMMELLD